MKLDLAEPRARELRELLEEVRTIFLTREEPAVPRRASVAVPKFAERGIMFGPRIDAGIANVIESTVPQRFVVVAQCEHDVARTVRLWRTRTSNQVTGVVTEPVL